MYVIEFGWVLVNFVGVFDLEKYVIWFNDFYFSNFVKLFFLKDEILMIIFIIE